MGLYELIACPQCRGSEEYLLGVRDKKGNEQYLGMTECSKCGGSGWRITVPLQKMRFYIHRTLRCNQCLGKGEIQTPSRMTNFNCPDCQGTGRRYSVVAKRLRNLYYCHKCEGKGEVPVNLFHPGVMDTWKLRLSRRHPQLEDMFDVPKISPSLHNLNPPVTTQCPHCDGSGRDQDVTSLVSNWVERFSTNIKTKITQFRTSMKSRFN